MFWDDQPATEQQLLNLRQAGFQVDRRLTRTEAARLIRELRRNPAAVLNLSVPVNVPSALPRHQPEREPAPASPPAPHDAELSEATRMHAHNLRTAAEAAQHALAANSQAPNARADSISTTRARHEFWIDTCREFKEMHIGSMQVFELYQRFGCRFYAPNSEQTQQVLEALDGAMPLWDRDHPELFYQALELNFPQLVRRRLVGV